MKSFDVRSSDPAKDVRLLRALGFANLALGCALIAGAAFLHRFGLVAVGLALTTVGVSVHSIATTVERRERPE